ncbi:MAG: hypothetical protein IMZ74_00590 [Actinobacteria bacterium]|nr:hypothetical protein [Actinomycetota bacterium]
MVLMFEEIAVELVAIAAALAALACLVYLIALTLLERRELRRLARARVRENQARRRGQDDASPATRSVSRPQSAPASGTLTAPPTPARRAVGVSRP